MQYVDTLQKRLLDQMINRVLQSLNKNTFTHLESHTEFFSGSQLLPSDFFYRLSLRQVPKDDSSIFASTFEPIMYFKSLW